MRTVLLLLFVACAAPKPLEAPTCPPVAPAPAVPAAPTKPDEAAIKARSHQLFDAFDRADAATCRSHRSDLRTLEEERYKDRDLVLGGLRLAPRNMRRSIRARGRASRSSPIRYVAIFIGEATEHVPSDGPSDRSAIPAANTLVWVHEGDRWVAASWTWYRAGIDAERERWNRWLVEGTGFNHKPNQTLVDAVKGKKPGTALDIAMGQGRNALFLATQGWKVTGIDISDKGIALAREEAAKLKVKLYTVQSDIDKYDLGKASGTS